MFIVKMSEENNMNDLCKDIQQRIDREKNNQPDKRAELLTKIWHIFFYNSTAEQTEIHRLLKVLNSVVECRFYIFVDANRKPVRMMNKSKSGQGECLIFR
ncbi:hypothetical protein CRM79_22105 [Pantoea agglomerans]|nr:hypothetical protein CRM79_22105 [Pantoea agglomerans]